jgi:hypothetical protein
MKFKAFIIVFLSTALFILERIKHLVGMSSEGSQLVKDQ